MSLMEFWAQRRWGNFLLLPLAWIFLGAVLFRRWWYRTVSPPSAPESLPPVVVVGSIVAGGAGKTPLVMALVRALQKRGLSPAVVSRGYGGERPRTAAMRVEANSDWRVVGDEPLLIARECGVPVAVGAQRQRAVGLLPPCDVVISDDGLQHYAMARAMELAVVKGDYGLGNGWLLPAGPLREPESRLSECDATVKVNTHPSESVIADFEVIAQFGGFVRADGTAVDTEFFRGKTVAAVAGIAHPQAFFEMLKAEGVRADEYHPLADHARLSDEDLAAIKTDVIVMTQKDAVKYAADARIVTARWEMQLPSALVDTVINKLPPKH